MNMSKELEICESVLRSYIEISNNERTIIEKQQIDIRYLKYLLTESLRRLEFAKERDPDQLGIYHYQEAIGAVNFQGID
jgi:hypothetical protein